MKDLPPDARPREKLLARGPGALADVELLALLLRTGTAGQGVLHMAQALLDRFGGLTGLLDAGAALGGIKGLGPAKRAELMAVLEIARRCLATRLSAGPVFDAPQTLKDYLQLQLGSRPHEVFAVLWLDARHRMLAFDELFRGSLTQTSVHPREVVKRALALNAAAAVLAHNHPSGVADASRADEALTQLLQAALKLVDVRVLDHVVVSQGSAMSFVERGLL